MSDDDDFMIFFYQQVKMKPKCEICIAILLFLALTSSIDALIISHRSGPVGYKTTSNTAPHFPWRRLAHGPAAATSFSRKSKPSLLRAGRSNSHNDSNKETSSPLLDTKKTAQQRKSYQALSLTCLAVIVLIFDEYMPVKSVVVAEALVLMAAGIGFFGATSDDEK